MKNVQYLEAYRDHLQEEEKSKGTIDGYCSDVKDFMAFIKKDIKKLSKNDVINFKEYLRQRKLKTLTINRKLVGVKQFLDFANERYELSVSARVKQEKIQKQYSLKDEELLTEKDYKRLVATAEESGDIRSKALFDSMYFSGMRISEALQLRVDHVQNGLKIIEDIKGKGNKYRDIYMSDKLIKSLREYLEVRNQPYASTTNLLFTGERGPITRQTAHTLIKKYAKKSGIEETKAHVHNLRHLFGLRLAAQGVPIQDIAKYMGHTSIEVTKIYLEKPQSHYVNLIDQL
jgi:integrase/recombinase XerD